MHVFTFSTHSPFWDKSHTMGPTCTLQTGALVLSAPLLLRCCRFLSPHLESVWNYNKPIRDIVCACALDRVKPNPLSCANRQCALMAHVHTTCRFDQSGSK